MQPFHSSIHNTPHTTPAEHIFSFFFPSSRVRDEMPFRIALISLSLSLSLSLPSMCTVLFISIFPLQREKRLVFTWNTCSNCPHREIKREERKEMESQELQWRD